MTRDTTLVDSADADATTATVAVGPNNQRSAEPLLDRGTSVGRYLILEPLGSGGMSVVYAAYDPELDRRVAIKLMKARHWGVDGRTRLLREAQAMARLSHPNVAAVFDVGTLGDEVFMAMELVDGVTLKEWLAKESRGWRQVVDTFRAVARGLVAAHDAGLIHRDVKPANILLDRRGRPRLVDFGVARAIEVIEVTESPLDEAGSDDSHRSALDEKLTKAGSAVGTPAYMAPEQREGVTDERTDQFGFCVSLYEALYGRRPSRAEVREGVRAPRGRSHPPRWLRAALERGLAFDASARFGSMRDLLSTLDRVRARRSRFAVAAVATVALAATGIAFAATRSSEPRAAMCTGAKDKLTGVWDDAVKQRVRAAMVGADATLGKAAYQSVERRMNGYTRDWVTMHRASCEATNVRGEQSEKMLDARTACLTRRLDEVRAVTKTLAAADRKMVARTLEVLGSLSPIAGCADLVSLSSRHPPPSDPAVRERVAEVRAKLAEARALGFAGKHKQARPILRDLVREAKTIGHPPLTTQVLFTEGLQQDQRGESAAAAVTLHRAAQAAETASAPAVKVRIWLYLSLVLADRLGKPEPASRWCDYAEATLARLKGHDDLRAALLERRGMLAAARGDPKASRQFFLDSLELAKRVHGADSYEVGQVHLQLALTLSALSDHAGALKHARRELAITRTTRGEVHPATALSMSNLSIPLTALGKFDEAKQVALKAVAMWKRLFGPNYPWLAMPYHNLGEIELARTRYAAARDYFGKSLAVLETSRGKSHADLLHPLSGLGATHLALGELKKARSYLQRAERVFAASHGANNPRLVPVALLLAETELAAGRLAEAATQAKRATGLANIADQDPRIRGRLRFVQAQLVWRDVQSRDRAIGLAKRALTALDSGSPRVKQLRAAVRKWLAARER